MSGIEIIGFAAAIAQLIVYATRTHSFLVDLRGKLKSGYQPLKELLSHIDGIIDLMDPLKNKLPENSAFSLAVVGCIEKSKLLQTILRQILAQSTEAKSHRIMKVMRLKKYEKTIQEAWKEVHAGINILHLYISFRTHDSVEQLSAQLSVLYNSNDTLRQEAKTYKKLSRLPSRNIRFVGREALIQSITKISKLGGKHNRLALVGLGGVGKSQLAIECAYQLLENLPSTWVIYISAISELAFKKSYCKAASLAGIYTENISQEKVCYEFRKLIDRELEPWLLIIDSIDEPKTLFGLETLHQYLPEGPFGSIIFTTRNKQLAHELLHNFPVDNILQLTGLDCTESIKLLQSQSGDIVTRTEDALELVNLLDNFPLALSQAASYMASNCLSICAYLRLYQESESTKIKLLSRSVSQRRKDTPESVVRNWLMSFHRIESDNAIAAQLLCFIALLHYQYIPAQLLPFFSDKLTFLTAMGLLKAYSFISDDPTNKTFEIHPLVRLVTREWMRSTDQFLVYLQKAVEIISERFPADFESKESLDIGEQYSIHVESVLAEEDIRLQNGDYISIMSNLSRYLRVKGRYKEAQKYAETSLQHIKSAVGENDSRTLMARNDLGIVYLCLGNAPEAEILFRDVLRSRKQQHGDRDPDTLTSMDNLGLALYNQGMFSIAEQTHREALDLRKQVLGANHDQTLKSLNNLGNSLRRQGKYKEAKANFFEVVTRRKESLGMLHVNTLSSISNLASIFHDEQEFPDALLLYNEEFYARKILLGSDHPETLRSEGNIALVLLGQGQLQKAEDMTRSVLESYRLSLGSHHLETVRVLSNLAYIMRKRKKYEEAKNLYQQVVQHRELKLKKSHPKMLESYKDLNDIIGLLEEDKKK